jgi:hypothetical protein
MRRGGGLRVALKNIRQSAKASAAGTKLLNLAKKTEDTRRSPRKLPFGRIRTAMRMQAGADEYCSRAQI